MAKTVNRVRPTSTRADWVATLVVALSLVFIGLPGPLRQAARLVDDSTPLGRILLRPPLEVDLHRVAECLQLLGLMGVAVRVYVGGCRWQWLGLARLSAEIGARHVDFRSAFKGYTSAELAANRRDYHPNALAHSLMGAALVEPVRSALREGPPRRGRATAEIENRPAEKHSLRAAARPRVGAAVFELRPPERRVSLAPLV